MKRYGVQRCDEGGTLTDSEGNAIDHTWDVVDREHRDGDGHPRIVQNTDRRSTARTIARDLNTGLSEALTTWASAPSEGKGSEP